MREHLLPSDVWTEIYSWDPTFRYVFQSSLDRIKIRITEKIAKKYLRMYLKTVLPQNMDYFRFEYSLFAGKEPHVVTMEELPCTFLHRHFLLVDYNKSTGSWASRFTSFGFFEVL